MESETERDTSAAGANWPSSEQACGPACECRSRLPRRDFLRAAGLTPLALMTMPAMAGPFESNGERDVDEKHLTREWLDSLTERGTPTVYRGSELDKIGMPIGGIGAGQLYLGGDGKLWRWDIFNIPHGTGDAGYAHPPAPDYPTEQGFALEITSNGNNSVRKLDCTGFRDITFCGQYPIGTVTYRDSDFPIEIELEAFSPFIPLNADDSSLPATILEYTLKNAGKTAVEVTITGWLQNPVGLFSRPAAGLLRNRIISEHAGTLLECSAAPDPRPAATARPDRIVEDWHAAVYTGWTVEGTAFGSGPILRSAIPSYQGDVGGDTERVVNSHASAPGTSVEEKDRANGKLTSSPILLDRNYMTFWIGGGAHAGKTCLNLVVDGKIVRSADGRNNNRMSLESFDIREWSGKQAVIQIVDNESGPWGNIGVGRITLSDNPPANTKLQDLPDYGELVLGLLGSGSDCASAAEVSPQSSPVHAAPVENQIGEKLVGSLGRKLHLKPGEKQKVAFVLAWRFNNLTIDGLGMVGRHYATRFASAADVVRYIQQHYSRLADQTRLWRDTWFDSTLPHWFLDRTLLTVSTLATSACYRFANGRFYAWEGVGCCAGTCTHVWHYAHAMSRLFPELERDTRERVDFSIAFHPDTGVIGFRAEFDGSLAVDGQAGTLLRAYREHQMSPDKRYLARCWPRIKAAYEPLFKLDGSNEGVLHGPQMNTLDQPWFGKISWLSSLYVAALRAGEAMAQEMDEPDFAARCRTLADRGSKNIDEQLFNGEYYIQKRDESHGRTVGSYDGCEIDQVFGAGWAGQVGLSGVLPRDHVVAALKSLWKYSFLVDVGPYRAAHKPGRWYALAGEAGLLMCSWPHGDAARASGGYDFYLNECMTGFEYQAAGHMLREGLVTEGLAVTRAIHDRYHASKRNPWNEVECGDHYSRAMAGFGVYLSVLGYRYHGPKGSLSFAPRVGAVDFKAAFTAAEGWGAFACKRNTARLEVRWGKVRLNTLSIPSPAGGDVKRLALNVKLEGRNIAVTHVVKDGQGDDAGSQALEISFPEGVTVRAGQKLDIRFT